MSPEEREALASLLAYLISKLQWSPQRQEAQIKFNNWAAAAAKADSSQETDIQWSPATPEGVKEAFQEVGMRDFNELARTMTVKQMADYITAACPRLGTLSSHGEAKLFHELVEMAACYEGLK